jgi:hypothetical protein
VYEHRQHRMLPWPAFLRRAARHLLWAALIIVCAVLIGTIGYHRAGRLGWLDAFLNASMILSGMGPVDPLTSPVAKVWASVYALFAGVVFVAVSGVLLAPVLHRVLHKFHLDQLDE